MKTPRQLILEIRNLKENVSKESAESILNTLTSNKESFNNVFFEDWYESSVLQFDDLIMSKIDQTNPEKFKKGFELHFDYLIEQLNENYPPLSNKQAQLECDKLQTLINRHYEIDENKVEVISVKVSENGADDFDPLVKCKIIEPYTGGTFFTTYHVEYFKANAKAIEPE